MIYYDSHKWRSMMQVRGSVFPKACMWGLPSAIVAYCLKYADLEGVITLDGIKFLTQGSIYSGFTFVLGFTLVFRTSQAYSRYWSAATSIHEMGSEWTDACASLIAFCQVSKHPKEDVERFMQTVVRLFCLLHAMALEEIADLKDENFPLIDIQGFEKEDLMVLTSTAAQGKKLEIVLSWIKVLISQALSSGLLSVPAPIVTRVFQELGAGLVKYHTAQQVVIWPFPFPYTQMSHLMTSWYLLLTPMVISTLDTPAWACALFAYMSVVSILGIGMIASELENPFGEDPNDLPVFDMQEFINKVLLQQLNPATWSPPRLKNSALAYGEIVATGGKTQSLAEYQRDSPSMFRRAASKVESIVAQESSRAQFQRNWAAQDFPEEKREKVANMISVSKHKEDGQTPLSRSRNQPVPSTPQGIDGRSVSPQGIDGRSATPQGLDGGSATPQGLDGRFQSLGASGIQAQSATAASQELGSTIDQEASVKTQPSQPWREFFTDMTLSESMHLPRHSAHGLPLSPDPDMPIV